MDKALEIINASKESYKLIRGYLLNNNGTTN